MFQVDAIKKLELLLEIDWYNVQRKKLRPPYIPNTFTIHNCHNEEYADKFAT